jgi:hypothetical protein
MKQQTAVDWLTVNLPKKHKPTNYDTLNEDLSGAEMVKVRGCEYIRSHVYLGSVYTHCGDCNNSQHKMK